MQKTLMTTTNPVQQSKATALCRQNYSEGKQHQQTTKHQQQTNYAHARGTETCTDKYKVTGYDHS